VLVKVGDITGFQKKYLAIMTSKIVIDRLIVSRYTKALFEMSQEKKQLDLVWRDFVLVEKVLEVSPKARAVVDNPFIPADTQIQLLKLIKSNSEISDLSYNFIQTLIKNNRLYLFNEIKSALLKSYQEYNNELEVEVISNVKLDGKQIKEISSILEKKFDKKIICNNEVDSQVLGGVVVKIGSKMIDCSLASKLKQFVDESKKNLSVLN